MIGVTKVHAIIILLLKVLSRLSKNASSIPRMHDFLSVELYWDRGSIYIRSHSVKNKLESDSRAL